MQYMSVCVYDVQVMMTQLMFVITMNTCVKCCHLLMTVA